MQDGGFAAQQLMEESRQSVAEVKRVVADARRKAGLQPQNAKQADFNEDDYMDGMTQSPSGSSKMDKYVWPPTTTTRIFSSTSALSLQYCSQGPNQIP